MTDAKVPPARLNSSGELEFEMEGVAYLLRPSMDAVDAIERQTGRALLELANGARSGSLKAGELAVIVAEMVKAWGREADAGSPDIQRDAAQLTPAGVRDHLYSAGLVQVNSRLAVVLMGAVSGGYDPFGRAKGAWAKELAAPPKPPQTPAAD